MKTIEPAKVENVVPEPSEDVSDVDSIMEELATAEWWSADSESLEADTVVSLVVENLVPVEEGHVRTVQDSSKSDEESDSATMIGLALAVAATGRGIVRRREED